MIRRLYVVRRVFTAVEPVDTRMQGSDAAVSFCLLANRKPVVSKKYMYRFLRAVAEDDVAVKLLFDHLRNLGIAAVVLGAGVWKFRNAEPRLLYLETLIAGLLGVFGVFLFFVNLFHGIGRLKKAVYPKWVFDLVLSVYSLVTVTIVLFLVTR
jgi:hypothetical protein